MPIHIFFLSPLVCYFVILLLCSMLKNRCFWFLLKSCHSSIQAFGKRNEARCAMCCHTDLCNNNCKFLLCWYLQICLYSFIQCCTISFKFPIETTCFSKFVNLLLKQCNWIQTIILGVDNAEQSIRNKNKNTLKCFD